MAHGASSKHLFFVLSALTCVPVASSSAKKNNLNVAHPEVYFAHEAAI